MCCEEPTERELGFLDLAIDDALFEPRDF